jgi:hypothetical protein
LFREESVQIGKSALTWIKTPAAIGPPRLRQIKALRLLPR